MGNKLKDQEIILLLFTLFGILVVLFLLLLVVIFQTWGLWKIAKVVVAQNTEEEREIMGSRRSVLIGRGGGDGQAKERFE